MTKQRDQLSQQNIALSVQVENNSKQMRPFKELQQLDPELYLKAIGIAKQQSDNQQWKNLAEIQELHPEFNDMDELKRQNQNLIREKGDLAKLLEKTQTLLANKL